jgi:hypothetical protein
MCATPTKALVSPVDHINANVGIEWDNCKGVFVCSESIIRSSIVCYVYIPLTCEFFISGDIIKYKELLGLI